VPYGGSPGEPAVGSTTRHSRCYWSGSIQMVNVLDPQQVLKGDSRPTMQIYAR